MEESNIYMTESEAIEELKYDCKELGKAIPCDTSWGSSFENAYRIAIQAIEKQIPKKPQKTFEKLIGVWCSCGKYFVKGYFVDNPNYCPNCGQKLDWNDE